MKMNFWKFARSIMSAENGFSATRQIATHDLIWALGSFCALHSKPFDPSLVTQQFPPPQGTDTLIRA